MKDLLYNLYCKRQEDFKRIQNNFKDDDLAGPLLMSPGSKYSEQKNRLLIIGQETKGWGYDTDNLLEQMALYEQFNVGEKYYASPFWNVTRKVEAALGNEPFSCAWTNLSKFDLNSGPAYGKFAEEISKIDNILIEEIKILQPRVCLFYTGPYLDERLKSLFNSVQFIKNTEYPEREFCQLKHVELPELSFRSYHPNYLRRSGMEEDLITFIASLPK